ncbi:MAG: hypothetical protein FVQ83_03055 [Chloroflexi bacterium]|nr:hypothetical protein [Chloroflexota bacterium]
MNLNLKAPISTIIAIGVGVFILSGYFIPLFPELRTSLLTTAMLLVGFALFMGVINLSLVHLDKIRQGSKTALYSFLLIISMFITFVTTILQGPDGFLPNWLFSNIQIPVETSLMAVLTVSLAFATVRLLTRRLNLFSIIFVFSAMLILLGSGPIFGFQIPFIGDTIRPYLSQILAGAGARGILLGIGLGTVATGLRILMGADRPFGG